MPTTRTFSTPVSPGSCPDHYPARLTRRPLVVGRTRAAQYCSVPGHLGSGRAGGRLDHLVRTRLAGQERTDRGHDTHREVARGAQQPGTHGRYHTANRRHRSVTPLDFPRKSCRSAHLRHSGRERMAPGHQGPASAGTSAPPSGGGMVTAESASPGGLVPHERKTRAPFRSEIDPGAQTGGGGLLESDGRGGHVQGGVAGRFEHRNLVFPGSTRVLAGENRTH